MKSRLRHPITSIREPFGTAGLIVAMVALVAALGGTAFAAAKLNSTQKKEVEKIAKKYAGKAGANGTNGTNGAPGAKGDAGAAGTNGTNGAPGESVTNTAIAPGPSDNKCNHLGGAEFKVGSGTPTKACNGQTGYTETLPSGKTEQGNWGTRGVPVTVSGFPFKGVFSPISFVIPLGTAPAPIVIGIEEGKGEANEAEAIENEECMGTVAAPGAGAGKLCIFVGGNSNVTHNLKVGPPSVITIDPATGSVSAANPAGTMVWAFAQEESEPLSVGGTWAVTG